MKPAFLILAGTTKAGTSSMFDYLSAHTAVRPTLTKQVDYFVPNAYPWKSGTAAKRFEEDRGEGYLDLFEVPDGSTRYLYDASPDTMYVPGAADNIARCCGVDNTRMLFLLRDPVSRFESWYRFAIQQGMVAPDTGSAAFLEMQTSEASAAIVHNVLATGFYSRYIEPFLITFGRSRVHVLFQEDLSEDPRSCMKRLAESLDLSSDVYDTFEFRRRNVSGVARSGVLHAGYVGLQKRLRSLIAGSRPLAAAVTPLLAVGGRAYRKANMQDSPAPKLDASVRAFVERAYAKEYRDLLSLEIEHPWT